MFLVVLLMIALLTERGAIALSTTLVGTSDRQKFEAKLQAKTLAEAGFAEAKARLRSTAALNANYMGDPATSPDPLWSAYLVSAPSWTTAQDPEFNAAYKNYFPTPGVQNSTTVAANSLQTAIPYWGKVRYKHEYDAELEGHTQATPHYVDNDGSTATHTAASPGNIIYEGYPTSTSTAPGQFTTAGATAFPPVTMLRLYGQSGSQSASIVAELAPTVGPNLQAASYAKGTVTWRSTTVVSGHDNCGVAASKPPLFLKTPATSSGTTNYSGNPSTPQSGGTDLDLLALVNSLKAGATVLKADKSSFVYGSSSNYVVVYSNTLSPVNLNGLKMSNGEGYGLLLIEGDLIVGPEFEWHGLVIVTGTLTYKATSASRIYGAVLSNQTSASTTVDLSGNMTIRYDSCHIANSLAPRPMELKRWSEHS